MNQERKAQWVAALRSGKYEQGQGYLHQNNWTGELFCCLGVACDLAWQEGVAEKEGRVLSTGMEIFEYEGHDCYPPAEVREWLGFGGTGWGDTLSLVTLHYEDSHGEQHTAELDELNDTTGLTFDQIADLIERWM